MQLFHSSKSNKKPNGILTHWGSMKAAALRVESVFCTAEQRAFAGGDKFVVVDNAGRPKRLETLDESLDAFVAHANGYVIGEYPVEITNPLRLVDCWEDDPIGSGGPNIFEGNTELNENQKIEIQRLFHPFKDVIYPWHVSNAYSQQEISRRLQEGNKSPVFKGELAKRKERSSAIGEDFRKAVANEVVWVELTTKIRQWALRNDFDTFVYENQEEVLGEDSYVSLKGSQIKPASTVFRFDTQKYRELVSPAFKDFIESRKQMGAAAQYDIFWGGHDPLKFWTPSAP